MKYTDVFVPGGFPKLTYNPRESQQLEEKIEEGKNNLCKLITITGQTKTGKTVLTKKIYPKTESIWIDGGTISNEEDFWVSIVEQLGMYQSNSETSQTESTTGSTSQDNYKGDIGFAGVTKSYSKSETDKLAQTSLKNRTVSNKILAIKGLTETQIPVIIDDFHYISRENQGNIVRALKAPIFDGVPVIVIAIPHKRFDAVKVEKEMTGRISIIQIPIWSSEELSYIARTGFDILKLSIDNGIIIKLANEAVGSPHLMQEFCRNLCKKLTAGTNIPVNHINDDTLKEIYTSIAENIGRPIFEKLIRGPRQRADRKPRTLKNGATVDIYGLILSALAFIKPGLVSIEYEDLRQAIKQIIDPSQQLPQLHEIARVLKYMSQIAATDESSAPVIDFDEQEKKLHITDPFFSFYLKWGKFD